MAISVIHTTIVDSPVRLGPIAVQLSFEQHAVNATCTFILPLSFTPLRKLCGLQPLPSATGIVSWQKKCANCSGHRDKPTYAVSGR